MGMQQASLFGAVETAEPVQNLFLAFRPDEQAARLAQRHAETILSMTGGQANALPAERLHVSLYGLGEFSAVPPDLLPRVCDALAAFSFPLFALCLDEAMNFNDAVVLKGAAERGAIHDCHARLGAALARGGLIRKAGSFTPHMTLLYSRARIATRRVEPVCWQASEVVLVRSLVGHGQHETLERWPLSA